jgi:hypothetical protein
VDVEAQIFFSGFCEPWANPECTEMIELAHQRGHVLQVYTSLFGMSLKDVPRLASIPFRKFFVHLPTEDSRPRAMTGREAEVFSALASSGVQNLRWVMMRSPSGDPRLHSSMAKAVEGASVPGEIWDVNSRAGNLNIYRERRNKALMSAVGACKRRRRGVLLPNGDVTLCCMDWSLTTIIGNLYDQPLSELYSSGKLKQGVNAIPHLCRSCDLPWHLTPETDPSE